MEHVIDSSSHTGWQAELELGFSRRNSKSTLSTRRHYGPLQVQRPFYPEGPNTCHVYILHPPGGIAGGDELRINVKCESSSQALITTPGAGKFYRCHSTPSRLDQSLTVNKDASLEWFPQETILFDGARAKLTTRVKLAEGARFTGWEVLCLGRPAGDYLYRNGDCRQAFELYREGRPVFVERSHLRAGSPLLTQRWGLNGKTVTATLVATLNASPILESLRNITADGGLGSVTQIEDDVVVCRYLGDSAESARRYFSSLWSIIRPELMGIPACMPRIWNT